MKITAGVDQRILKKDFSFSEIMGLKARMGFEPEVFMPCTTITYDHAR